jgi:RimJ/RimL family protein N-acetyltransferase
MNLIGSKIILREMRQADLERMHAWVNDEAVVKNLSFSVFPRTLEDTRKFLNSQLERSDRENVFFAIAKKTDAKSLYLGTVGLKNIDYIHRKAEMSVVIGGTAEAGKGFGTEAVGLICTYGFEMLNLNKIYLKFIKFNEAASRVYQKIGFKAAGELQADIFYRGQYHDQVYMEFLAQDYFSQAK